MHSAGAVRRPDPRVGSSRPLAGFRGRLSPCRAKARASSAILGRDSWSPCRAPIARRSVCPSRRLARVRKCFGRAASHSRFRGARQSATCRARAASVAPQGPSHPCRGRPRSRAVCRYVRVAQLRARHCAWCRSMARYVGPRR